MSRFRVELLNGAVVVRTAAGTETVTGVVTARVLATLAMKAGETVPDSTLKEHLDVRSDKALQKRISELRKLDLKIDRAGFGYRLDLPDPEVDARWFIGCAGTGGTDQTYDSVCAALAVWRSGPPARLLDDKAWRPLYRARDELERQRVRLTPRRLLIVEDRVGERLRRILGQYECTVVRDLAEFWRVFAHLDRDFDAVLVDMHLGADYHDNDGTVVVETISRSRTSVPIVVMTFSPLGGWDITAFQQRYNVVAVVTKGGDDDSADFSAVAEAVHQLFAEDIQTYLVNALEDQLPRIGRYAEKWLSQQGRETETTRMRAEHEKLYAVARHNDLAALRVAVHEFQSRYGSPAALHDPRR
ncbi:hypothetical protein [Amycolatopsis sp. NPDC003731]